MRKILLRVFLIFIICSQALAESSVWKIQKGESVIFLGGTIHILRESDFPLPEEFEKAYSSSDMVVLETDIGKFNELSTQQELMSKAMYSDGSTVDKHLSAETYELLNKYCDSNSIPLSQLKMFKPSIIAVTIEVIELSKFGAAQEGVDMHFYQSAKNDRKVVGAMESVDEQIDYIVEMGKGNEDAFIKYSMDDLTSIEQNYEIMVEAWEKGDDEKIYELMISEVKSKMPKLYQELIVSRNDKWLPLIDAYLDTPEREFVLVGMGHLVGPEGIIKALRQNGYKVEKL